VTYLISSACETNIVKEAQFQVSILQTVRTALAKGGENGDYSIGKQGQEMKKVF
jgi:hypothetical protein